ncbi:MAG: GFA family protein [Emcibacter sp.]|nr:GFA family protein [Emcibacter sp.]
MSLQTDGHEGGCSCGHIRYKIISNPLIVHCCHCRWCQRQTGAAFALNALFEADHVVLLEGDLLEIIVPSPSGNGQKIARCPKCKVAVWSNYFMGGIKDLIRFIRVGTLDNPAHFPPDVHIFTTTKQPWVILPPGDLAVDEFYEYETTWTQENFERRKTMLASVTAGGFL